MAPHRILIWGVVLVLVGSVASHIEWRNIPRIGAALGQFFPHGGTRTPSPRGETVEARRDRLKDAALTAGRQALAQPCDAAVRRGFKDALIDLARQRMRDMGCTIDFVCNVENGFKEVSFTYYATDKDRRVSDQVAKVAAAGGIAAGEIGIYQFFIGHPEALAHMLSATEPVGRAPCPGIKRGN